ncbi:sensor histidine kinase [Deinococcus planocerae]|uniref:sensor histidine kinase n=1 Tax=Deinococcus planocerae TaxID=1737569 RepID=UPI000C7EB454|nr:ATP-binding protein [Deinococcus planocerae]
MTNHEKTSRPDGHGARRVEGELHAQADGWTREPDLFGAAPVASFLLDARGRIREVNGRGCALLGFTREALVGEPLGQFVDPASRPPFEALLGRVFDAPALQRDEVRVLGAGGQALDMLLDAVAHGEGCSLVATDVTAHREALRVLESGNADLSGQLQERTARARALNEELEQVVGSFIQQLRGPTERAMNVLGLLRRALGTPPEGVGRSLLHIERALQQIVALFESVDRYMQARGLRARLRPVDLNAVLREVLKDVRALLQGRSVEITHDPLPVVQGDSQALTVILTEYLSNALKFTRTREQARLHILVEETEAAYHIGVRDNGVGFDPRGQERLFRLFGRQHSSSLYEGSGLGLAVIRRTCERFGGRAWGEGQPGEGATFWFAWPKRPVVLE